MSVLGGFLTGVADSALETYNSDFSDIDSMVSAFVGAGGVENYTDEKKKNLRLPEKQVQ